MQAIANQAVISLRTKPSVQAPLVDEIIYGMPVEIIKTNENITENTTWCLVRTHYRYEGYCLLQDLITGSMVEQWQEKDWKVIRKPYADVLDEPRVQGLCMQSIPRGGRISYIEEVPNKEGWVKVRLVDGRQGYTKESYLDNYYGKPFTTDEEVFRQRVVEMAKSYLGTQYRWGGKTPLGIDCSGLTSMSYMLCGVLIYRDASIAEGFPVHEIPFAEKKPGDLLYFPGHIAMYIGDNLYIHSTGKNGSDGVVINSFDSTDIRYREDLPEMLKYTGSIF